MTVTVLELWTICVMFQLDNVSVEHRLMEGSVINVNQAHGIIRTVKDACVMDTLTDVTLVPEYALTAKVLLKEIIVIGVYYKKICLNYMLIISLFKNCQMY